MSDDTENTSSDNTNDDDENEVRILAPDYSLKKKIGMDVDIHKIFTPERIEAAQKAIDDAQEEFIQWAEKDLVDLEHAYRSLEAAEDDATRRQKTDKICKIAFSLKCQSGTFGYDLGSWVANSLYRFILDHTLNTKDQLTVIRKHIDAMQVIFTHHIQGQGDQTGQELMDNLEKLIAKFS